MGLAQTEKYLKRHNIKAGLTSTLIADRALARGIEVFPDAQRRLTMKVGGRYVWFDGSLSNINSVLARRCVRYKDVTSRLLQNYDINAATNVAFSRDQLHQAWAWAEAEMPVVVKPPNDGMGDEVHVGISDFAEFQRAFAAVGALSESVLVERFIPGVEHRVLLIHGKVAAAARRIPAHVVGDGVSTIAELVEQKNRLRTESANPVHFQIPVDDVVVRELAKQSFALGSVPAENERAWLRPNSNVHSGGDGVDATDELRPEEVEMAEQTAKAIPGLRIAGLDLLLPRDGQGSAPHVLEINGTPMITGHHYPWYGQSRDVAAMLVESMFGKESDRRPRPPEKPRSRASRQLRQRLRPLRPLFRR
ncbi:hypothetical protein [Garicola koreensis]|uniref:D-alanine-D-alanine ligase-like ATP-grasp enzyme n=1 Tax=Garicola koreensis TaxID=1262554 RepID=A0A7W5TNL6_9MICC|nr:hypothetical protein [Garicola koreensis]MBB3666716.1 D-alanine-D-alanine ligase-like ATP-grasp enzyme [Garicola koreensis]